MVTQRTTTGAKKGSAQSPLPMLRRLLLLASLLVLGACSGGKAERLISFQCENLAEEKEEWRYTLEDISKKLDEAESLEAFHSKEEPWVFDKETGDLYEYDEFEESFVPIKDLDTSSGSGYDKYWTEYSSKLSKDGKKFKIKMIDKTSNILLGERVEGEYFETYDIEENTVDYLYDGTDKGTEKCMLIPTTGIDVQWLEKKS